MANLEPLVIELDNSQTLSFDLVNMRNWSYFASQALFGKSRSTLFSQTLKLEENKVFLLFTYMAQKPKYGHFVICSLSCCIGNFSWFGQDEKFALSWLVDHTSKRPHCFLQHQNLKKNHWSYFFHLQLGSCDMVILIFGTQDIGLDYYP